MKTRGKTIESLSGKKNAKAQKKGKKEKNPRKISFLARDAKLGKNRGKKNIKTIIHLSK